jgi:predicted DNA-binding transcriptional regulator YafY
MQLGEHIEVLEPIELRHLIAASARELVARYASADGPSAR